MHSEEIKLTEYLHNIIEENISLRKQNDILWKQKLEYIDRIGKAIKRIELLGKFDGEHCTRNFKMMSADFNYLLEILKGDVNE